MILIKKDSKQAHLQEKAGEYYLIYKGDITKIILADEDGEPLHEDPAEGIMGCSFNVALKRLLEDKIDVNKFYLKENQKLKLLNKLLVPFDSLSYNSTEDHIILIMINILRIKFLCEATLDLLKEKL